MVHLPRIPFKISDKQSPFEWQRRQFPVRPAFAMTINKAQGQSLKRVGVYLDRPCFAHGQLYVAASRARHPSGLRFAINSPVDGDPCVTRNIVYREVLQEGR